MNGKIFQNVLHTDGLINNVDYRVVSLEITTDLEEVTDKSLDEIVGMPTMEFYRKYGINSDFSNKTGNLLETDYNIKRDSIVITTTEPPTGNYFYKPEKTINFDSALTFNFGVVEMLKGKFKGDLFLYNLSTLEESPNQDLEEMIMLKLYHQYTNPHELDRKLDYVIETNKEYIYNLIRKDKDKVLREFSEMFKDSRIDNVIYLNQQRKY